MAQIGTLETFTAGSVMSGANLNSNYVDIIDVYNAHDGATTGVHGVVSPSVIVSQTTIDETINKYFPIGSLFYMWDNNDSAITDLLDSDRFKEMNGGDAVNDSESLYDGMVLPDMTQILTVGAEVYEAAFVGDNTPEYPHVHSTSLMGTHTHTLANHTHSFTHANALDGDAYISAGLHTDGYLYFHEASKFTGLYTKKYAMATYNYTASSTSIANAIELEGFTTTNTQTSGSSGVTSSSTLSDKDIDTATASCEIDLYRGVCKCFLRIK